MAGLHLQSPSLSIHLPHSLFHSSSSDLKQLSSCPPCLDADSSLTKVSLSSLQPQPSETYTSARFTARAPIQLAFSTFGLVPVLSISLFHPSFWVRLSHHHSRFSSSPLLITYSNIPIPPQTKNKLWTTLLPLWPQPWQ